MDSRCSGDRCWSRKCYLATAWMLSLTLLEICACAPALKTLLHFKRRGNDMSYYTDTSDPLSKRSAQPASKPSLQASVFNATSRLPWSHESRSRRESVKLQNLDHSSTSSQLEMTKGQIEGLPDPTMHGSCDSGHPPLQIVRRCSVEMQSLRPANTRSTVSHRAHGSLPEDDLLAHATYDHVRKI